MPETHHPTSPAGHGRAHAVGPARPGAPAQGAALNGRPAAETTPKLLIVGADITLAGEITACDRLVVKGSVQITLNRTRTIEIAPGGRFTQGRADVGY